MSKASSFARSNSVPPTGDGFTHWVPHAEAMWLPGKKVRDGAYETEWGVVAVDPKATLEVISDGWATSGVDDICVLSTVSPATLLHALRVRYSRDEIYTYISCILIAVNPFKRLNLYSSELIRLYQTAEDTAALKPHIFGVSSYAFNNLIQKQKCQAILISGESGAGKTENTKFVLLYLNSVLKSDAGLEDSLLQINPILESFGNAKTVRNDNSSRFGKWIEILVNAGLMRVAGASITDYLLEVTRVCAQGPDERNYHIFYQLTTKEAIEEYPMLSLEAPKNFHYLKKTSPIVPGLNDQKEFLHLKEALTAMRFTAEEEENIFRVTAGILHLGNIDFVAEGDGCKEEDPRSIKLAAEVLLCDPDKLSKCICFKRRVTGRDTIMTPLLPDQARLARDSLAKMVYGRLFQWLVHRSNSALGAELKMAGDKSHLFIGVLDIAGFEFFQTNLLEQLFINLSNEKLQQFFNNAVFKSELAEYQAEGIPITSISYTDNQEILNLIEGKGGILQTLEDSTLGIKTTDEQYTAKVIQAHEKHPNFVKPKFTASNKLLFGVKHYAGEVMYTTTGFLEKNVSQCPTEFVELMSSSKNCVLQAITKETDVSGTTAKTVSTAFRRSLQLLIQRLSDAEANFVRCIKPNKEKVPAKFEAALVLEQLKLSGAMETVKIRQSGFLIRQPCLDFAKRYLLIYSREDRDAILKKVGSKPGGFLADAADGKAAAGMIIQKLSTCLKAFKDSEVALGKTKVFIKSDLYRNLEETRRKALIKPTIRVQSLVRGHLTRKIMNEVLEINRALRKCTAEAGEINFANTVPLKSNVQRATVMESSLTAMDVLLNRAVLLPIKLPNLPLYMRARGKFAAQVNISRQLSNLTTSLDVINMEAMIARASSMGIKGPLVDACQERSKALAHQLRLRRILHDCAYYDVLQDVQKVTDEAKGANLDKRETWLLSEGPENWEGAVLRLKTLEAEQAERARAVAALELQMKGLCNSLDVTALEASLVQSSVYNMSGPLVDNLKTRCATLKTQTPVKHQLQEAAALREHAKLTDVLSLAKGHGLHVPSAWLLPDGPKMQSRAARAQQELSQAEAQLKLQLLPPAAEKYEDQEEEDLFAGDHGPELKRTRLFLGTETVQALLGGALVSELTARCDAIEKQIAHRRSLQGAWSTWDDLPKLQQTLAGVAAAGLEADGQWLLAEGPRLRALVAARRGQLEEEASRLEKLRADVQVEVEAVMASTDRAAMQGPLARARAYGLPADTVDALASRSGTLETQGKLRLAFHGCALSESPEQLEGTVADAKAAKADQAASWLLADGPGLFDALVARLQKLPDALRVRERLKACDCSTSLAEVESAVAEAKGLGLDSAEQWVLPDGPACWALANARLQELQEEDRRLAAAKAELEAELKELLSSVDIAAMRALLPRLAFHSIQGAEVQALEARIAALDQQLRLRASLKACGVSEQPEELAAAVSEAEALGLQKPGAWLLPDAEALLQAVVARLGKLPDALRMREQLQVCDRNPELPDVQKAVAEAKGLGLGEAEQWVLPGGPACWAMASGKCEELEEEERKVAAAKEAMGGQLGEMMASVDIPAMKALLPQLAFHGISGEELEARIAALEKQYAVRLTLKVCALSNTPEQLRTAIADATALGLNAAEAWLLPDGPKIFADTALRLKKMPAHLKIRRLLFACQTSTSLEEVRKTVAEARTAGLDKPEAWVLVDGPVSWGVASERLAELEEEERRRVAAKQAAEARLAELLASTEVSAMRALQPRLAAHGVEGESVEALAARITALDRQFALRYALKGCVTSESPEHIHGVVTETREAGLGDASAWLLSDCPDLFAGVVSRLQKLPDALRLRGELQKCIRSESLEEVRNIAAQAKGLGLDLPENWVLADGPITWTLASARLEEMEAEDAKRLERMKALEGMMEELLSSVDAAAMKALVPRLEFFSIAGAKVDSLAARIQTLDRQVPLRLALRGCGCSVLPERLEGVLADAKEAGVDDAAKWLLPDGADFFSAAASRLSKLRDALRVRERFLKCASCTDLQEVAAATAEAKGLGLDKPEGWVLADGPACSAAVARRLQELEEEAQRAAVAKEGLSKTLAELLASTDVAAMKALLPELEYYGGDVRALAARVASLEAQGPVLARLRGCPGQLRDADELKGLLASVTDVLGAESKWLWPDGPAIHARAQRWLEKVETLTEAEAEARQIAVQEAEVLAHSLDTSAMKALLSRLEAWGESAQAVDELRQRCQTLERQLASRQALAILDGSPADLDKRVAEAEAAGLAAPETALVPDGPRLVHRAKTWRAESDNLSRAKPQGLSAQEEPIYKALKASLTSDSADAVLAALRLAQDVDGLAGSQAWQSSGGLVLESLAVSRLEQLQDRDEHIYIASCDALWQLRLLQHHIKAPAVQSLLGAALVEQIKTREGALQAQLPHRDALYDSLLGEEADGVERAIQEAAKAELGADAERWLLTDGPRLVGVATQHLQRLRAEAKANEDAVEGIEGQMRELLASKDLPAMRGLVARSERCKVNPDLQSALRARADTLQRQIVFRQELQRCAMCEELQQVQQTMEAMREAGLDSPEGWLLPDGPKLFAHAMNRQEQLLEVEGVKTRMATAASKFDVPELQASLTVATNLGVAGQAYSKAHQLFLNLQDGAFVEQKSSTLIRSGSTDPVYLLIISNLATQMKVLGVEASGEGMSKVARGLSMRQRSRSVFVSKNAMERALGQRCFEDLSTFPGLRDSLAWGAACGVDPMRLPEAMLHFSPDHIAQSLTDLRKELNQVAVATFTDILRRMGDMPDNTMSEKDEPILNAVKCDQALCDEVYVQLMKQLTANPSEHSCGEGWAVLMEVVKTRLPTDDLRDYFRAFLNRAAATSDEPIMGVVKTGVLYQAELRTKGRRRTRTTNFWEEVQPRLAQEVLDAFVERCEQAES